MSTKGWPLLYRPYKRTNHVVPKQALKVREADHTSVKKDVVPMIPDPALCLPDHCEDNAVFTQMWMCNAQCPKTHKFYRKDLGGCARSQCAYLDEAKCRDNNFRRFCKYACDRILHDAVTLPGTKPGMPTIKRSKSFV